MAYKLSEVIHCQKIQREQRIEKEKLDKFAKLAEGERLIQQAEQWIDDQKEQMRQKRIRAVEYKQKLKNDLNANELRKLEFTKKLTEADKLEMEAVEKQLSQQYEKEKAALETKKEQLRQNALEAMKLSEERRISIS